MSAPPLPGGFSLPDDAAERKRIPVCTGVLDYFPDALIAVAVVSRLGNDQHNPGQPLHWARGKGGNNADELLRHLIQRGTVDTDGMRHSAKVAWRALAILQLEIEADALKQRSKPVEITDYKLDDPVPHPDAPGRLTKTKENRRGH